jgi:hypothetical protein
MPDLIQVADDLKNMPDQWLGMQAQNPTGVVPPYLVVAEIQRRQKLRSGASKAQAPQSSVSQDLIRSLQARMPPAQGLPPGSVPPEAVPPGMPPPNLSGSPGSLGPSAPGTPPASMRMPGRMAAGGSVDDDNNQDDYTSSDPGGDSSQDDPNAIYNLALQRNPSRDQMLAQLYSVNNIPAIRRSDPRFQPMDPWAPGAAGKDVYGRSVALPAQPQPPDVSSLLAEQERAEEAANQKPEDMTSDENVAKARNLAEQVSGGEPDTGAFQKEADYLHSEALKAKPTWQNALMEWGMRLMSSKEHNFGVAAGQAGVGTLTWADQQRQQARQLELARLKTQAAMVDKLANYKEKVGAETVSIMNTRQRQQEAGQNANLQHLYKVYGSVDKQAQDWEKRQDAANKALNAELVKSQDRHMTFDIALAGKNNPDAAISGPSQRFLDDKAHWDEAAANAKEEDRAAIRKEQFDYEEEVKQRNRITTKQTPGASATGSGKERAWTDADRRTAGLSMITDELGKFTKIGGTYYNQDGYPVKDAAGNDVKAPQQLYQIAKEIAAGHVMDPNLYADHPHFGDANPNGAAERERVHNRIRAAIAPKDLSNVLVGRHFHPTPEGITRVPALKDAEAKEPPQQQVQPQQPKPAAAPQHPTAQGQQAPAGWAAPGTPGVPLVPYQMAAREPGSKPIRIKSTGDIWWKDPNGNILYRKENAVQ